MKNFINYYYNINIIDIYKKDNIYYFYIDNELYYFYIYNNDIKYIDIIKDINDSLKNNTLVSEIITNKDNSIISYYNNIPYILCKINININKPISLGEINYLSHHTISTKVNIIYHSWQKLWSIKIDYLENLINENGKKYPTIVNSFNYFIGMSENAISYYNNINNIDNNSLVVSHRTINIYDTIYSLYDPTNFIIDHKSRDIAEYIKYSFFNNNKNIYNELDIYFKNNYYTKDDILLLLSRVLYPSFYFNLYEDIMVNNKKEDIINTITDRLDEYEVYLSNIFIYFRKYYDIPLIDWINKK